ncbi:MAG: helix-turn-helix transcriptional regulator [Clostridia bacterium]|nr:helix-turn-helix transcriptional regulator [Clostridia bacterium]
MIFADKLIEQRKRCGWSQEELAEKLGVSRQAVSKWEGAQSTPDLQRVLQMADLFGVTTDYLLKDELEIAHPEAVLMEDNTVTSLRQISMQEANEFLQTRKTGSRLVSMATAMCVTCPALLILLVGLAESRILGITEGAAAAIGVSVLLLLVAAAVFIFITYGMKASKYEWMEKEGFETAYGVTGMVQERKRAYERTFTMGIAVGVVLCIVAVVPLIIAACAGAPDYIVCGLTSLMLVIIAGGVYTMIRVGMINSSYDALLEEGEYAREEKRINKKLDSIAGAYWCLATAVYLGWSFITNAWDKTWIVWPVAGVLYAVVHNAARSMMKD